jgi:hypothetical protein
MDPVVDVAWGTCHFVVAALLLLRIVPTRLALKRQ